LIATQGSTEQLIRYFTGAMEEEEFAVTIGRNPFIYKVANLIVGIKEHLAHLLLRDEGIERGFEVTDKAKLLFMSHCQDPEYAEHIASYAKGRKLHLGHTNAAGAGTHGDGLESLNRVLDLVKESHITGEFVSSLLRPNGGCRDGLLIEDRVRDRCYEALNKGEVKIIISDGQAASSFKGFDDTRDNIPCLLELQEKGVLSLKDAIATMTSNVTRLLSEATEQVWWTEELGHLGQGARANITIVDPKVKRARYTFVNGTLGAFESRVIREAFGSGGLVTKYGILPRTGYGEFNMYSYQS
jgi:dihydroorotase